MPWGMQFISQESSFVSHCTYILASIMNIGFRYEKNVINIKLKSYMYNVMDMAHKSEYLPNSMYFLLHLCNVLRIVDTCTCTPILMY